MASKGWRGSKWIRKERRLALYLRDGLACVYCGRGLEEGVSLSLDHLLPRAHGGTGESENLVTCCQGCNSAREDRPVAVFVEAVARRLRHGIQPAQILEHISQCRHRRLQLTAAARLLTQRGSIAVALATLPE